MANRLIERWRANFNRPSVRITTIEGRRHVTKGNASITDYGKKRRGLVSKSTKVGQSRYGGDGE